MKWTTFCVQWRAAGVSSQPLASLAELSRYLCVTRKDFEADQAQHPPLGSNLTFPQSGRRGPMTACF
ncbi:MAG: hypothetical protein NZT92_02635 [Abditibacteriales bacterium]|nr:hypothetical protein [Abditibacteriales bacterium]MDW8366194.1 hypothetical protein [Abditibacteriales bacterium]